MRAQRICFFVRVFLMATAGWLLLLWPFGEQPVAARGQGVRDLPIETAGFERATDRPVLFIENVGQFDDQARFQVQEVNGTSVWLARDAIWMTVPEPTGVAAQEMGTGPRHRKGVHLKFRFLEANPDVQIVPFGRLGANLSYLFGRDASAWHSRVPVWGGVRYENLYPGVDLVLSGQNSKYSFHLIADSAQDLGRVHLSLEGANSLDVSAQGDLQLSTAVGSVTLPPWTFSAGTDGDLEHPLITAGQVSLPLPLGRGDQPASPAGGQVSTGNSERSGSLLYSTFLGSSLYRGSSAEQATAIAVDASSAVYVAGWTCGGDFPTTPGAFDETFNGVCDAFVSKLRADGSGLIYSTFFGGSEDDTATSIDIDSGGNAYVVGWTLSSDLPITSRAYDRSYNGNKDAYVIKLNPWGTNLVYGTYLGGTGYEVVASKGLAVDSAGAAYVAGTTYSTDFPTTASFAPTLNGSSDCFVTKLDPEGSKLRYSTFLGGSLEDGCADVALDEKGNAYVAGQTGSLDFPVTPGAFDDSPNDAFVAKFDSSGGALIYSTFFGGGASDSVQDLATDPAGSAYVVGHTGSSDFPTTPGAYDTTYNGGQTDMFALKLDPTGNTLSYGTFLGGTEDDQAFALATYRDGAVILTGFTTSPTFPVTADAYDQSCSSGDVVLVELDPAGEHLAYSTLLGGSGFEWAFAAAWDSAGNAYVAGETLSADFPVTDSFDSTFSGSDEAFVTKLALPLYPPTGVVVEGPTAGLAAVGHTFTATTSPVTATRPIVYAWEATEQSPAIHSNGLNDEVSFTWHTSGTKTITVTATNDSGQVVSTHSIAVRTVPPAKVAIAGPTLGLAQTRYPFTATVLPVTTTWPITYLWEATGQAPMAHQAVLSDEVSFTWHTSGTKTITVTAVNDRGQVVSTHSIAVRTVPPAKVAIAGPTLGLAQTGYPFTATVHPVTTTWPITYVWEATGQAPMAHQGVLSDEVSFTWHTSGTKTITVTATNDRGQARSTHILSLFVPVHADFVAVPTSGSAPLSVAFANTSTGDYTTSLWSFGDGVTTTVRSPTHLYEAPGIFRVRLTVSGGGGIETTSAVITVEEQGKIYLPLISRQMP